ncbi:PaaI family thioesterase [Allostreptomyces psammosilenae]
MPADGTGPTDASGPVPAPGAAAGPDGPPPGERAPAPPAPPRRHPNAPPPGSVLGPHYDGCFGCGPRAPGGLRLVVRAGEGVSVHTVFTPTTEHQGAPGITHGGMLAAALDETLGSLNWLLMTTSVTARLETDYRAPVPLGTALHLTARCTGVQGRKIHAEAEGRTGSPDGPLAVVARALFVRVGLAHFTAHGRAEEVAAAARDPESIRSMTRIFEVNS